MVLIKQNARTFNEFPAPVPEEKEPPTWGDMFSAALSMDNDVVNFVDAVSAPKNTPEPDFRLGTSLKEYDVENGTSFFDDYQDSFVGDQSRADMLYTIQKIREEEKNRDILARSGWAGYTSSILSGLASPVTFIPLVGAGTRAAQVGKMAAIGFSTGALSEGLLQSNQLTRTVAESAIGIAASTALAGILGGVLRTVSPEVRAGFEKQLEAAAADINYRGKPQPGGAAIVEVPDAGNIASGAQTVSAAINKTGVFTNPVTQNIDQTDFPTWRSLTQQIADAGLQMERNVEGVATAVGGTLENRVGTYAGQLNMAVESFDRTYAKYFYEGAVPKVAPNLRAEVGGALSSSKLSKREFADEVSRAIWNDYQHQIPEVVEAAQNIAKQVFEPILKEAQKVGLLGEDVKVVGDKAYVHRIYNVTAIQRRTAEFVNKLARNYEAKLNQSFAKDLEKLYEKQSKAAEVVEDVQRPGDEVDRLIQKYKKDLDELNTNVPDDIAITEETARDMRALARQAREAGDHARHKQLLADARDMERNLGGKDLQDLKINRANIRRRLRNLTQTRSVMDTKRARKLELIERIDDQNIAALHRVAKKAQTILGQLEKISDEKLDSEISKLKTEFERVGRLYDKGEEKLVELGETPAADRTAGLQEQRFDRLQTVSEKLEQAEGFDRATARAAIQEGLDALIEKVNVVNSRRAVRRAKLIEEQRMLSPEVYKAKLDELTAVSPRLEAEFNERWSAVGAESVDAATRRASFKDVALQRAEEVKDKIVGTYLRLPAIDMLATERGPELQRVLDISSEEIADFLETDIQKIVRAYTRTMGPDIELYRKFGSMDWRQMIQPAVDELNTKLQKIEGDETLSAKQKETKTAKLNADFSLYKKNFEALIERLRGVRGMPDDPEGFAYRAARTVMNLNVLRSMGMVTIASFPDLAQPVLKYGLTRTFRDGFGPLISNLKAFKMNAREAKLAGAAIDVTSHARAMAIRDVVDDLQRGSRLEKGVEWATNRMGLVALFDYWTQGAKFLTSSVVNAKIMDALAVVNGAKGNLTQGEATKYLAELGIDGNVAENIWKQIRETDGGGKVDGVWWPNTETWADTDAVMAYRQALHREIGRTIIQPGMERPLLSDVNTLGRMLYQFKSFGMAATPKVLLAGLQQRDAAVVSGSLASLALGAFGYYTWAMMTGGQAREDMLNAGLDKWADEAINRSGLIGGLSEVQRVAQNIPLIAPLASFSGKKSTRRPGDNLVEALLGPSFDFGQGAAAVIGGLKEPTQSTLHELRKLIPFQNTMGLREAIDAIEGAVGSNLPERRGQ
ncbi:MAG TPA: hypothetical protein VIM69_10675 [Opitutaceae bacterium]